MRGLGFCFHPFFQQKINGKATMLAQKCLECGHCVTLYPEDAFTMSGYDMNEVKTYDKSIFGIDEDILLNTIKYFR